MPPETRSAKSGDVDIAHQVVGDGPRDLVLVAGRVSNIEVFWEEPRLARVLERLASFSRLLLSCHRRLHTAARPSSRAAGGAPANRT